MEVLLPLDHCPSICHLMRGWLCWLSAGSRPCMHAAVTIDVRLNSSRQSSRRHTSDGVRGNRQNKETEAKDGTVVVDDQEQVEVVRGKSRSSQLRLSQCPSKCDSVSSGAV